MQTKIKGVYNKFTGVVEAALLFTIFIEIKFAIGKIGSFDRNLITANLLNSISIKMGLETKNLRLCANLLYTLTTYTL